MHTHAQFQAHTLAHMHTHAHLQARTLAHTLAHTHAHTRTLTTTHSCTLTSTHTFISYLLLSHPPKFFCHFYLSFTIKPQQ